MVGQCLAVINDVSLRGLWRSDRPPCVYPAFEVFEEPKFNAIRRLTQCAQAKGFRQFPAETDPVLTDFHSICSHGFIRAAVCLPHVRVVDPALIPSGFWRSPNTLPMWIRRWHCYRPNSCLTRLTTSLRRRKAPRPKLVHDLQDFNLYYTPATVSDRARLRSCVNTPGPMIASAPGQITWQQTTIANTICRRSKSGWKSSCLNSSNSANSNGRVYSTVQKWDPEVR
jgi:hypothetical protein